VNDYDIDGEIVEVDVFTFRSQNREVRRNDWASLFEQAFDPKDRYFTAFAKSLPKALSERNAEE
jgi:hypothetical protein